MYDFFPVDEVQFLVRVTMFVLGAIVAWSTL